MTKGTAHLILIAILAFGAAAASNARAGYVVTFAQVGPNVVETGSGTLDVTDLSLLGPLTTPYMRFIAPGFGIFKSGSSGQAVEEFSGAMTGPNNFGFGSVADPSSSSGDTVGVEPELGELFVPDSYVSGSQLSETSTFLNTDLVSIGMFVATYTYSWGSGAHTDTFTIRITDRPLSGAGSIPEPSTWAMMLIGFAGLGYAAVRQNRSRPVQPASQTPLKSKTESARPGAA